jgi:ATP-dependent DNA ligase
VPQRPQLDLGEGEVQAERHVHGDRLCGRNRLTPTARGSALCRRREGKRIVYAGKIQVGLPLKAAAETCTLLEPLIRPRKGVRRRVIWLEPKLEAEVSYSNMTAAGMLRHGILKGFRHDL